MQTGQSFLRAEKNGVTGSYATALSVPRGYFLAVIVQQRHAVFDGLWRSGRVDDLCQSMDSSGGGRNVNIRSIDIDSGCPEVAIQRQSLIHRIQYVQPYILIDTAIVAVEVLVIPLVAGAHFLAVFVARELQVFLVFPVIVHHDRKHILTAVLDIRGQIHAESHYTVLVPS